MKSRISYDERSDIAELHEYIDENSELRITRVDVTPGTESYDPTRFSVEGYKPDPNDSKREALEPEAVNRLIDQLEQLRRLEPTGLHYEGTRNGAIRFEFTCYGLEDE